MTKLKEHSRKICQRRVDLQHHLDDEDGGSGDEYGNINYNSHDFVTQLRENWPGPGGGERFAQQGGGDIDGGHDDSGDDDGDDT